MGLAIDRADYDKLGGLIHDISSDPPEDWAEYADWLDDNEPEPPEVRGERSPGRVRAFQRQY